MVKTQYYLQSQTIMLSLQTPEMEPIETTLHLHFFWVHNDICKLLEPLTTTLNIVALLNYLYLKKLRKYSSWASKKLRKILIMGMRVQYKNYHFFLRRKQVYGNIKEQRQQERKRARETCKESWNEDSTFPAIRGRG